jgi:cell division septation protein DedD
MGKKIKRIVVSIILLIAIVIIFLPFFQKNQFGNLAKISMNPPPFPDKFLSTASTLGTMPYFQEDKIIDLKKAIWVVHMGTFKNENKARHLVNQLRQQGYRAFIQSNTSVLGNEVRVYVGPEFKRASALTLAKQIENQAHVRGRVVNFKPFILNS